MAERTFSLPAVRVRTIAVLAAILAAAAVLRLHRLGEGSFWFDERASVMSSAGHFADWMNLPLDQVIDSPPDLTSVAKEDSWAAVWRSPDSHPPLYAIVLRAWREVFGESDAMVRGLSVVLSLAAIVILFDVGRMLADERAALWACAIMSVAQPQIQYAQEARGYALWYLLVLGACDAAVRLVVFGPGWRRSVVLALCLLGMLLTHFLAVGCAVAILAWCGIYLRGRGLRQSAVAVGAAAVVLCLLGVSLVHQAMAAPGNTGWMREDAAGHVGMTLWRAGLVPFRFLVEPNSKTEDFAAIAAVVYVLPWLLRGRLAKLCGLLLVGGAGFVTGLDLFAGTQALTYIRFTLACAPGFYLLISSLPLRGWLRHLLPAAAVVCCVLALPDDYETTWKGQWRNLGGDVRAAARPGDVMVFASPVSLFMLDPRKMYDAVEYYAHPIPCAVLLLDRPVDSVLADRLRRAGHVWLVFPDGAGRQADYLPGWQFTAAAPHRALAGGLWEAHSRVGP